MALTPPTDPEATLEELSAETGLTARTIRSYVARGLIPSPRGRGPAARYGEEHRIPLLFLQQVRKAVPYDLPLGVLERLLRSLPPSQVARIARGEEEVTALTLPDAGLPVAAPPKPSAPGTPIRHLEESAALYSCAPEMSFESRRFAAPSGPAPQRGPTSPPADVWSVIEVTPSLRLSMRGSGPETARTLADLAGRLRGWLADADRG